MSSEVQDAIDLLSALVNFCGPEIFTHAHWTFKAAMIVLDGSIDLLAYGNACILLERYAVRWPHVAQLAIILQNRINGHTSGEADV